MEIKRHKLKYWLAPALIAITLWACKKESTGLGAVSTNLPVVQAYLMAGKVPSVRVTAQKALTDTAKYGAAIKGLTLNISDGSKTVQLTETTPGTYTNTDSTFLTAGKTYTLKFNYLAYAVSAQTVMPQKPVNFATVHTGISIDALLGNNTALDTLDRLTWDNPDSLNHILVFDNLDGTSFGANSFAGQRPANFELNTDKASVYYITQRPFAYYGHYQIILFRVNQEYINLFNSNTSGATSSNLADQPTNVVNGLGIFTAMQADTVSFLVQ